MYLKKTKHMWAQNNMIDFEMKSSSCFSLYLSILCVWDIWRNEIHKWVNAWMLTLLGCRDGFITWNRKSHSFLAVINFPFRDYILDPPFLCRMFYMCTCTASTSETSKLKICTHMYISIQFLSHLETASVGTQVWLFKESFCLWLWIRQIYYF